MDTINMSKSEGKEAAADENITKLNSLHRKSALISLLGVIYLVLNQCSSYIRHEALGSNATEIKATIDRQSIGSNINAHAQIISDTRTKQKPSQIGSVEDEDGSLSMNTQKADIDAEEIDLSIDENHEPYLNRWQRRFASSQARNKKGGYLFFRHIRKAGGTSLRVYLRDAMLYHNISREVDDWRAVKHKDPDGYQIHYVEHEFQTLDWQCPNVDPRWQESLRVIVLRNPIERHLSEFFFSGAGKRFYPIDKKQLYVNETYTNELAQFMSDQVPKWMKHIGVYHKKDGIDGRFNMIFGRQYTDNFQLRSLAGCSSGECLKEKNVTDEQMEHISQFHPSSYSYSAPVARCTLYFRNPKKPSALFDQCAKAGRIIDECPNGCDGPCFFPSVAWGEMGRKDLIRAITVLKSFDAVLLTEKMNNVDQANFLSDILGVPRDANFSLAKRNDISNLGVEKSNDREKSYFYRDLLKNLGLRHVSTMLQRENKLEKEFYDYAEQLNKLMLDQWKREANIDAAT